MSNIKAIINLIACIIVIISNLYLTYLTYKDDKLLSRENGLEMKSYLLKMNRLDRFVYMINTILICCILLILIFVSLGKILMFLEMYCLVYSIRRVIQIIWLHYNVTSTQKELILHWIFNMVEDISSRNLSSIESEKILQTKVREKSLATNISIAKFNKTMNNLEKDFNKFLKKQNKKLK